MIASLRGIVRDIDLAGAVIECAGVGYRVLATAATLAQLRRGEEATVLTVMVVREDQMTLYGFVDGAAREMFGVLQSVSGLGPRLALAALSVYSAAELAAAISGSETKALQRIPGVGKRMAERMIVDLKDKVAGFLAEPTVQPVAVAGELPADELSEQVIEALIGLGFGDKPAAAAVAAVRAEAPELDTSGILRAALGRLGRG